MTDLPLVLVHGFMGGSRQWHWLRPLLERGHKLITLDLPGFADNAHLQAPDSITGFAEFVLEKLTKQKVDRFKLLGHSMGGMIVQEMMVLAPERIEQLVLYGTASTGNLPGRFETFKTSKLRAEQDGVEATAKRISATWFADYEEADEYKATADIAVRSSMQAILAGLNAMENWSRTDALERISCPTLIIWGELDRTYLWPQIYELWTKIPQASLAVMPACSHAAHMEKPHLFNVILDDFLTG